MKCQRCSKHATLHITEVLGDDQFEELHLCENCAQKYLYDPDESKGEGAGVEPLAKFDDLAALNNRKCAVCGIRFSEFRNSGRLGCPHDYEAFREELTPLLENIHGEVRHCGKTPARQPRATQLQTELVQLRKQLQKAVTREDYEEAAQIRDRIRHMED